MRQCFAFALVAWWLCGCGPPDEKEVAGVARRDSMGVEIVETDGRRAREPSQWTVAAEPDLQIGQVEGSPEYLFDRLDGVAGRAGVIVVVDGGSTELRYFDDTGTFLKKLGGKGNGPGEFMSTFLVSTAELDSIVVYDVLLRRFTIVDPHGDGFRTTNTGAVGIPLGRVGDQVLVEIRSPVRLSRTPGPYTTTKRYVLLNLSSGDTMTLGSFRGNQMFITLELNELPTHLRVPFTTPSSAAAGSGAIFISGSLLPEIREYDAAGSLRRLVRLNEPVDYLMGQEYAEYVSGLAKRTARMPANAPAIERVYRSVNEPDTVPAFDELRVSANGWLWARLYDVEDEKARIWIIFDSTRVARGSIETPLGLNIDVITPHYIIGRWRDSMDVEYVRRYTIRGPAEDPSARN